MALGFWIINTAGIGGIIVVSVFLCLLLVYVRTLLWVRDGARQEDETHASQ